MSRRHIAIGLAVAILAWLGLLILRPPERPVPACRFGSNASACTARDIITSDPYCLADPTCVSPWFPEPTQGIPRWSGFAILDDALLIGHPVTYLALANYVAFLSGCGLLLWSATTARLRRWSGGLVSAVTLFAILEGARWFWELCQLANLALEGTFLVDPRTYLALAAFAAPVVFATVRTWHIVRNGAAEVS